MAEEDKKCDGKMQPEMKKFSIDPQITSFEMLQGILARAFDIKSDFTISYLALDSEGQTVYLSMLSDWDMDAAFQCAADPCLKLKVDLRPFEEEMEDWDVIAPAEIPQHRITSLLDKNSFLGSITGTLSHNLGRTVNSMQRAMGFKGMESEVIKPIKPPMSDMEFHNFLDSAGFMVKPNEFRLSIYQGGLEPSLRRVAWRHLLNIFPGNMSGRDRFDYMKRKEDEYRRLRDEWRERFHNNTVTEEVKYVASQVKKDVLRTDRSHDFYAGNDENENTLALFHILVTYALTHPDISYCQGMSDLASPLLVTQKDEGQAYICFCALMNRLRTNFTLEGVAMMTKFKHLLELLAMYDPSLHDYLIKNSASEMFFCYRWFLLELKREFPFSDALYVLEVMWATLPPSPPQQELSLVDSDYSSRLLSSSPCSPTISFQHAMYAKLLAMRRVGAMHRMTHSAHSVSAAKKIHNKNPPPESPVSDSSSVQSSSTGMADSAVSSFDASPSDAEDKGADFPEVDNAIVRSIQQKSDSIDQVLHEAPVSKSMDSCGSMDEFCPAKHSSDNEDYLQDGSDSLDRAGEKADDEEEQFQCSLDTVLSSDQGTMSESDGQSVSGTCEDEQSVSGFCEDDPLASLSYEQIQVPIPLQSDSNNSAQVIDTSEDMNRNIPTEQNSMQTATGVHSTLNGKAAHASPDSTTGLFQSMKRLLSSPKKQKSSSKLSSASSSSPTRSSVFASDSALHSGSSSSGANGVTGSSVSSSRRGSDGSENSAIVTSSSPRSHQDKVHVCDPSRLPPPQEFGAGNPFIMFLCFTLISQHRDTIMAGLCYEEIAMHFDRLVRRHDAKQVLHHARQLYTQYLRAQQANMEREI